MAPQRTSPPGHDVLLFDGDCAFCRASAGRLLRWAPGGALEARSFREPGCLASFPGLGLEQCQQALQLVRDDGRVFAGVEGIVEALRHRPLGRLARVLRWPGIRPVAAAAYRLVARLRYRIAGRACGCGSGACRQ